MLVMIEAGEDLAFGPEATQAGFGVESPPDHLDSHLLLILIVGSHRAVNFSHPP